MKFQTLSKWGLLAFVLVSLGAAVADVAGLRSFATVETVPPTGTPREEQWVLYYFHSSHRCTTCREIEANTRIAVADQVAAGAMDFRVLNYEDPANKHFAAEFDLAFPTVILARVKDGSIVRWKNLERVWDLWEDRPAFVDYVQSELTGFKEKRQ